MSVMHINKFELSVDERNMGVTLCGVAFNRGGSTSLYYTRVGKQNCLPGNWGHDRFCSECEDRHGLLLLAETDLE